MQHTGKIFGSLYCYKFILKTRSSIYENHLLNATVDFDNLSKYYVGTNLLKDVGMKKVIKMLE